MRGRGWLGVVLVAAVSVGGVACRDQVPPQTPPPPRDVDTSNMGRAGFPEQQGIPTGETGEGQEPTGEPPRR